MECVKSIDRIHLDKQFLLLSTYIRKIRKSRKIIVPKVAEKYRMHLNTPKRKRNEWRMIHETWISRYQSWFSGEILSAIIFSRELSAYVDTRGCTPQYRSFIVPSCLNYLIGFSHFSTPVNLPVHGLILLTDTVETHEGNRREKERERELSRKIHDSLRFRPPSRFRLCKNAMKFMARTSNRSNWRFLS